MVGMTGLPVISLIFAASFCDETLKSCCGRDLYVTPIFFPQSTMPGVKSAELSTNNRQSAFLILWTKQDEGRLPPGALQEVANLFSVDRSTIHRLWRALKNKIDVAVNNEDGEPTDVETLLCDTTFFESGQKSTGRKKKWSVQASTQEVRNLRLTDRQNFRMLAQNIDIPYTTLRNMMGKGHFRQHSSPL